MSPLALQVIALTSIDFSYSGRNKVYENAEKLPTVQKIPTLQKNFTVLQKVPNTAKKKFPTLRKKFLIVRRDDDDGSVRLNVGRLVVLPLPFPVEFRGGRPPGSSAVMPDLKFRWPML